MRMCFCFATKNAILKAVAYNFMKQDKDKNYERAPHLHTTLKSGSGILLMAENLQTLIALLLVRLMKKSCQLEITLSSSIHLRRLMG